MSVLLSDIRADCVGSRRAVKNAVHATLADVELCDDGAYSETLSAQAPNLGAWRAVGLRPFADGTGTA